MTSTSAIRAIEHLGLTVPDISEASDFFVAAFDAEVMYDLAGPGADPEHSFDPDDFDACAYLGVRPGVRLKAMRLVSLGAGPSLELFEYIDANPRPAATSSDIGIQHLCLYVDDIDAVCQRVVAAGGTLFAGPAELPGVEAGPGNRWIYTKAPWGTVIELITYPSAAPYEQLTSLRRWRPSARLGSADSDAPSSSSARDGF